MKQGASQSLPNLIIAGAPKCGTTSVFQWLSDHPEVCGSSTKETYFLMDRESPLFNDSCSYLDSGLEGYKSYFDKNAMDFAVRVEATPDYIYQKTPLLALSTFPSMPKVVFILRDPVERAYSAYKFFSGHKSLFDEKLSFDEFVRAVQDDTGPTGHRLWPLASNTIRYGAYSEYLDAWRDAIGLENIHLYLYEDLKRDPLAFMARLAGELGIDSSFYKSYQFEVHNRSYDVNSIALHRLKTQLANLLPDSGVKAALGRIYRRMNVNSFSEQRSEADLAASAQLSAYYAPANDSLAADYGVDISAWEARHVS